MDLKARVKKYTNPGRSKDKANGNVKEKPKSDDENDSDKKSIFSSATKSPVRVFIRDQLSRKSSIIGSPKNGLPGSKGTPNGSATKRSALAKTPIEASPLYGNGAPAVPAKETSLTIPSSTETQGLDEAHRPVSMEQSKIETAVALTMEKVSPQPSPEPLTPEPTESHADIMGTNAPTTASNELKTPASFPKRQSSLDQSGQLARPVTIAESLSEDEDLVEDRKDSAHDSDEISEQSGEDTVPAEKVEEEKDTASGVEAVVKREGKVDELVVTAFLILLLVFLFYNPLFDVPNIKLPSIKGLR